MSCFASSTFKIYKSRNNVCANRFWRWSCCRTTSGGICSRETSLLTEPSESSALRSSIGLPVAAASSFQFKHRLGLFLIRLIKRSLSLNAAVIPRVSDDFLRMFFDNNPLRSFAHHRWRHLFPLNSNRPKQAIELAASCSVQDSFSSPLRD